MNTHIGNTIFALRNNNTKKNTMTLQQAIRSNPYLKPKNCTDLNDINAAIEDIKKLLQKYGSKKSLCSIYARLCSKKSKLELK